MDHIELIKKMDALSKPLKSASSSIDIESYADIKGLSTSDIEAMGLTIDAAQNLFVKLQTLCAAIENIKTVAESGV